MKKINLYIVCTITILISSIVNLTAQDTIVKKKLFSGQVGIAPYTFRKVFKFSTEGTLDIIKNMGFTEIEGGGAGMDAQEYKNMCDAKGLKIPSMGAQYSTLVTDPMSVVKTAKIYGSKYVMCSWIPHNTGSFGLANAMKAVQDFNKAGKILAENGITLCYHTHGYEVAVPHEDGTLLDYIIKNTDPNYFSLEMDVFWVQFGGGDPVAILKKYPSRFKMLHVKDMKKDIKKDHTGLTDPEHDVALGTGQIDIKTILKVGKEIGIVHYFIEDESSRIFDQLPLSIKYMKEVTE
jgi:sugar phosphate isomerase/epimerase